MKRFQKRILVAYAFLVSVLLVAVLTKSDALVRAKNRFGFGSEIKRAEFTEYYLRLVQSHERMDANVPGGSAIFIGDSITQGLCVNAVTIPSVNYGIGSDTTAGVLNRLPKYRSLERASVVIYAIGVNDIRLRDNADILKNYRNILQKTTRDCPIVLSAVLPIDGTIQQFPAFNSRIRTLNQELQHLCAADPRCVFVNAGAKLTDQTGNLSKKFHNGDGIHLNCAGYTVWIAALKDAIKIATHR
ncbi:MAG: GDSL-type esterase/lipase family protein [Planctomycetaceae bacterium]|nr:GDSL-type esterase/lipase family protein [Planctomycetaceae bacterium]